MGTRYGASYGELWCSEFSSTVLNWVSAEAPVCDTVDCFWGFYTFQYIFEQRISPEGYAAVLGGADGLAALSGGVAEPGDYLAMSSGDKGSHSGLFLAHNSGDDVVWHIGGNESGGLLCTTNLHQCGKSAVFISPHERLEGVPDGDAYHDMLGLNWWMTRR